MAGNMTKKMLREYLKGEVEEGLLHYVAMNPHEVLYLSPEQFCEKAGVDEGRALSFFRAFGADSFIAFKYILRKCLYHEVNDKQMFKRSLNSLADEVLQMELRNLTSLAATLDYDMVDRLAEDILSASEVDLLFRAAMAPIARTLGRMLWLLNIRYRNFANEQPNERDYLDSLPSSGLVIVFGRKRYSMRLLMDIKQLRRRGMRVVCFTDHTDSPFIPLSDYHFVLPTDSFDFTDSSVAGTAFMHILSLCIAMKREEELYSRMHQRAIDTQENNMFW